MKNIHPFIFTFSIFTFGFVGALLYGHLTELSKQNDTIIAFFLFFAFVGFLLSIPMGLAYIVDKESERIDREHNRK